MLIGTQEPIVNNISFSNTDETGEASEQQEEWEEKIKETWEYPLEELIYNMDEINSLSLFQDMYSDFQKLENYTDYEEYSVIYPKLLPALYAVKSEDLEMYKKFYSFLFDKIKQEDIFFADIKQMVWEYEARQKQSNEQEIVWEEESINETAPLSEKQKAIKSNQEVKDIFLSIIEAHYDSVISNNALYNGEYGDGPLHIAVSWDTVEDAKRNCDASGVSWVDEGTKQECYNYIYHYRATSENQLCESIEGKYQKEICKWYLEK